MALISVVSCVGARLCAVLADGDIPMPIGDYCESLATTRCGAFVARTLGTLDLHSHIRLRPLCAFLRGYLQSCKSSIRVVEVGCGSGINAFELLKISRTYDKCVDYIGADLNENRIRTARSVCTSRGLSTVRFYEGDAVEFLRTALRRQEGYEHAVDIVLLMDVIEHLHHPEVLLEHAHTVLRKGGLYLVSVPTLLYPLVFGRRMHNEVGHVVDGYSLEALDELFVGRMHSERVLTYYNTGLLCNVGCFLYYRVPTSRNKYVNVAKCLLLYPFKYTDVFNGKRISCSLFAVYRKV